MHKKPLRKLTLNRETLLGLEKQEIQAVHGASDAMCSEEFCSAPCTINSWCLITVCTC